MDMAQESVYWEEIDKVSDLLVGDQPPSCMIAHQEFANACLNRTMLNIAFDTYRHHCGISNVSSDENR